MKLIVLFLIVVTLSGCVGVNGEPLTQELMQATSEVVYEDGFTHGCMRTIFAFTTPEQRPPFDVALAMCFEILTGMLEENGYPEFMGFSEVPEEPVIDCSAGNCL